MSNRAWVTLATNDSYGLGALVLAHSLRRAGSVYPSVVLITPSVTDAMRDRLSAVFAEVVLVDVLDSRDAAHLALLQRPELGITFTKIHCWTLTQYEKCVFLDADTLVVQNCDELFEREELSAAPDVGWPDCFNSGVFVYIPSQETFDKLVQFAKDRGSFDGGDQGLLNSFFSDWAQGDISKHLPFLYNVTSAAFYSYLPALKHYGQNLKIIHFIGAAKPWLQPYNWESRSVDAPDHLKGFLQLWWDFFVSTVHPNLDTTMVETDPPPALPPPELAHHYEPTTDPNSEFTWHHPETQTAQQEEDKHIDLSQFYDPWEHYRGNVPSTENQDGSNRNLTIGRVEITQHMRDSVWEYKFEHHEQIKQNTPVQTGNTSQQHHHTEHHHFVQPQSSHNNNFYNHQQPSTSHYHNNTESPSNHNHQHDNTNDSHHSASHFQEHSHHHTHSTEHRPDNPTPSVFKNHHSVNSNQEYHNDGHVFQDVINIDLKRIPNGLNEEGSDKESCDGDNCELDVGPRHPYDGFYLRHRSTVNVRGHRICTHEIPQSPQPSTLPKTLSDIDTSPESQSGVAGNLARVTPGSVVSQREALDELSRRQGWETGNIDYMGADSFANIWAKISQTLSQGRTSPPKEGSPPKQLTPPPKEPSPPKEKEPTPQPQEVASPAQPTKETVPVTPPSSPEQITPTEPIPPVEQPIPSVEQPIQSVEQTIPPVEQSIPPVEQSIPPVEQSIPPAEQTIKTVEQPIPPVEQPIPPVEQPIPAVEQPIPPVEQPIPPVELPIPPVEQPIPAVEQPIASVEQPIASVEQPIPAVEQPIPPVEQPVPPLETPIPPVEQPIPPVEQSTPSLPVESPAQSVTESIQPAESAPTVEEAVKKASIPDSEQPAKSTLSTEEPAKELSTPVIPVESKPADPVISSEASTVAVPIEPAVVQTAAETAVVEKKVAEETKTESVAPVTEPTPPVQVTEQVTAAPVKTEPTAASAKPEVKPKATPEKSVPTVQPSSPTSASCPQEKGLDLTPPVGSDSPPLAHTPSKEETQSPPAAKSAGGGRKPAGKLRLSAPAVADTLPTPDSEVEDAATLAQSIIAGELRTPTLTSPTPPATASPQPAPTDKRLDVDDSVLDTPPAGPVSLAQIGVKAPKGKASTAAQIASSVETKPESASETEPTTPVKEEPAPKKKVVKKVVKKEGEAGPVPPPRKKEKKPKDK